MSATNELTRQIIKFIYPKFGFAWRQNSTGIVDPIKGFRTGAKKGVADILACVNGKFVAIELKMGKDRLSDEQIGFIKSIQYTGGIAMVVSSWEDFQQQWESLVVNKHILTGISSTPKEQVITKSPTSPIIA